MQNITEIFCWVDDLCQDLPAAFLPQATSALERTKPGPKVRLTSAEILTILIVFHQSDHTNFKAFYIRHVRSRLRFAFPDLVSYSRFIERMRSLIPEAYWVTLALTQQSKDTGLHIIDSCALPACHNKRMGRHKVMRGVASWGKTSMGWFFGMKLHIVINHEGELERFVLTPGHVHDVSKAGELLSGLQGLAAGDRGYISKDLAGYLAQDGLKLVTTLRKNMKEVERSGFEAEFLRRRVLVETVIDQIEDEFKVKHTRHRSPFNFVIHTLMGLAAYCFKPNKPSMAVGFVDPYPTRSSN